MTYNNRLDLGFEPDVRAIVQEIEVDPKSRQTAMFSATWPESIQVRYLY